MGKHITTLIICFFIFSGISGQDYDSCYFSLRVVVDGINRSEGTLIVGIADKQNFEIGNIKDCNQKVSITSSIMELNFDSLKAGDYAILAVVKEEVLDSLQTLINPLEEQTGFSQNIKRPWKLKLDRDGRPVLFLPKFEDVKFHIPTKKTLRILLGNPSKSVELLKETSK